MRPGRVGAAADGLSMHSDRAEAAASREQGPHAGGEGMRPGRVGAAADD